MNEGCAYSQQVNDEDDYEGVSHAETKEGGASDACADPIVVASALLV